MAVGAVVVVVAVITFALLRDGPVSSGDEDEIRDVIARYIHAGDDHDGEAACKTLTPDMRDRYDDCDAEAWRYARDREGRTLSVTEISGRGEHAGAIVNFKGKIDGQFIHTAYSVGLEEVDGEWLIEKDASCLGPPNDSC
jgi:hypothetical protein